MMGKWAPLVRSTYSRLPSLEHKNTRRQSPPSIMSYLQYECSVYERISKNDHDPHGSMWLQNKKPFAAAEFSLPGTLTITIPRYRL